MQLSIKADFAGVQKALNQLQADIAKTVTVRTVNRTTELARTAMSREIRAEYNITAAKVREKLVIKRASLKAGRFEVEAELLSRDPRGKRRSVNLINFAARANRKGVVTVKVKKGGARKRVGPRAFIGNKGRTVFERTSDKRLPIRPVQTVDVPQMFNTRAVNRKVMQVIRQRLPEVFERELAFALSKFNGAAR
jgi:hypothetical protein